MSDGAQLRNPPLKFRFGNLVGEDVNTESATFVNNPVALASTDTLHSAIPSGLRHN